MEVPSLAERAAAAAPELSFAVEGAGVLDHAALPTLRFDLRARAAGGAQVRALSLNVQLRVAAARRAYSARERERLAELFGTGEEWARNLHSLHWTTVALQVPPFAGETLVELHVPCTYDFELAVARYFHALEQGEIPLELLFSGSVFYAGPGGGLQVARVGWDKDVEVRLPVAVWDELMERHYPGRAWLLLRRDLFDRLYEYRSRRTLLSWDDAVEALLREAGEG